MKDSSADAAAFEPATLAALRAALLDHYDHHARDLPWRRDTDPYRVLVSEIMLQQTRVETVKGYYDPWLERFPSVDALARADEDDVLKAWEGLGYYRRARNLHRAARLLREDWGSEIPRSVDGLRALPGVGEYTAGAIASIAFDAVVPAVDGNVKRVLARLLDEPDPKPGWLRATAGALVDPERPGDWNQALMELGATVCTPRSPRCDRCPWSSSCRAHAAGTQAERPTRTARPEVPAADFGVAVLHSNGSVLLVKRPYGGLLGGMWAFPEVALDPGASPGGTPGRAEVSGPHEAPARAEVVALTEELGFAVVSPPVPLPPVRHRFTHLAALYLPWAVAVANAPTAGVRGGDAGDGRADTEYAWVDAADPGARALPRAQQRILEVWNRHRAGSGSAMAADPAAVG